MTFVDSSLVGFANAAIARFLGEASAPDHFAVVTMNTHYVVADKHGRIQRVRLRKIAF